MKVSIAAGFVLGALAGSPLGAGAAPAQPTRQDPAAISSNTMIGSPVYNEGNQRIGTLEDILLQPTAGEPRLVLSVGDIVGHDKKVAVPLNRVVLQAGHLIMIGGTKEALEKLPAFSDRPGSR